MELLRQLLDHRMLVTMKNTDRPPNPRLHDKCPFPQQNHGRPCSLELESSCTPFYRQKESSSFESDRLKSVDLVTGTNANR
jgi:hypothetical protein